MINTNRLKQARELQGLTQMQLAEAAGVDQSAISLMERGLLEPTSRLVEAVALQLRFPPSFFSQEGTPQFPFGSLAYRKTAAMTQTSRVRARRYAEILLEIVEFMLQRLDEVPLRVPRLTEPPEIAARITRGQLGLSPDLPVPNVVLAVERVGVLVFALPYVLEGGDAFSAWAGTRTQRPIIVLGATMTGDRLRFTMAHELGHLVLHQAPSGDAAQFDREADQFAAEFLMPEAAMREAIQAPVTLGELAKLKLVWKVSIQALIRRARDLQICSERQYRYLCEQVGALGWRTNEPGTAAIPIERPRAVRQMAELLYGHPIDYQRLASDMHLSSALVSDLLVPFVGREDLQAAQRRRQVLGGRQPLSFNKSEV